MTLEELLKKWNGGVLRGAQFKLAKALSVSHPSVSAWVSGQNFPSEELQPKVAKALGVSTRELLSALAQTREEKNKGQDGVSHTPRGLIGIVCTISAEPFNCTLDVQPEEFFAAPGSGPEQVFALRIMGDWLAPLAQDHDIAIISRRADVIDGQLYVVRLNGECIFRRLSMRGHDHVELKTDKIKSLRLPLKDVEILGKVIGFFRKP
jgi:SOS-response transcriptional repressor LexA